MKTKLINKDFVLAIIFIVIGVVAIVMWFIGAKDFLDIGLICGFLPTGIGLLIVRIKTANSPKMQKKLEIENEERNLFIRSKAGHSAFWLSYYVIFICFVIGIWAPIFLGFFSIIMLILMPVVYFIYIAVYSRKY
jgi:hypothetical protein